MNRIRLASLLSALLATATLGAQSPAAAPAITPLVSTEWLQAELAGPTW